MHVAGKDNLTTSLGDPLGPLLFALVLHKLVMKLDAELGADLLLNVCMVPG